MAGSNSRGAPSLVWRKLECVKEGWSTANSGCNARNHHAGGGRAARCTTSPSARLSTGGDAMASKLNSPQTTHLFAFRRLGSMLKTATRPGFRISWWILVAVAMTCLLTKVAMPLVVASRPGAVHAP